MNTNFYFRQANTLRTECIDIARQKITTLLKSLCRHSILDIDWAQKEKLFNEADTKHLSKVAVNPFLALQDDYSHTFDCFDIEDDDILDSAPCDHRMNKLEADETSQQQVSITST